jgi:hypothetical protein
MGQNDLRFGDVAFRAMFSSRCSAFRNSSNSSAPISLAVGLSGGVASPDQGGRTIVLLQGTQNPDE